MLRIRGAFHPDSRFLGLGGHKLLDRVVIELEFLCDRGTNCWAKISPFSTHNL